MKNFLSKAFVLFVALSVSGASAPLAHAEESCGSICGINSANAKNMIQDPTCKASDSCTSCVVNALTTSQSGAYCSAYNNSNKAKTGEVINASLNTAATVLCGVACVLSSNPATAGGAQAWTKACGYSGLAVTAVEVGYTIANIAKGQDAELLSLAGSALSAKNTMKIIKVAKESTGVATKMTNNPACFNTVMYGIAAAAKISSISKMKKASGASCDSAKNLAGAAGGAVQSCLAQNSVSTPSGSSLHGLFAATPETFPVPKIEDVNRLQATSGQDKYLKELRGDLEFAEAQGKFDLATIAKRIDSGESVSSILAGTGVPESAISHIKTAEERMAKGDRSKLLAHMAGGGYIAGEGTQLASAEGVSEMGFGEAATPGEVAESLEIDRKPAESAPALFADGDVFHASFPGTIFDIVSLRIKDQKNSYAELEPEGRMNRVFNGYSDPKAKKERKPAAK